MIENQLKYKLPLVPHILEHIEVSNLIETAPHNAVFVCFFLKTCPFWSKFYTVFGLLLMVQQPRHRISPKTCVGRNRKTKYRGSKIVHMTFRLALHHLLRFLIGFSNTVGIDLHHTFNFRVCVHVVSQRVYLHPCCHRLLFCCLMGCVQLLVSFEKKRKEDKSHLFF